MASEIDPSQANPSRKADNRIAKSSLSQAVAESEGTADNPWITTSHPRSSKKATSESRIEKIQKKRKRDDLDTPDARVNIDLAAEKINEMLNAANENEEGEEAPTMAYGRGRIAFKQTELIDRAFAADGFEQEFATAKEAAIAEDAPNEEDLTLPGWGAWTGQGVKKRATEKKLIKKIPGIEQSKRKDAKLKNVIINEKTSKAVGPLLD
jgi:U3 small nucleolar RNA-associated protein 14